MKIENLEKANSLIKRVEKIDQNLSHIENILDGGDIYSIKIEYNSQKNNKGINQIREINGVSNNNDSNIPSINYFHRTFNQIKHDYIYMRIALIEEIESL